jgi:thiamine kinase-like enzyme
VRQSGGRESFKSHVSSFEKKANSQEPKAKSRFPKEIMNTTTVTNKLERKKLKRTARKKRKLEHPLKPREYARGSQKRKVKKMVRGQSKR